MTYKEYLEKYNYGIDEEKLFIKYQKGSYTCNNKYYKNGYWFYFNIVEINENKKLIETNIIEENGKELLTIIYSLPHDEIFFVKEKDIQKFNTGQYPELLEFLKADEKTLIGKISSPFSIDYMPIPVNDSLNPFKSLCGLLFPSKEFPIRSIDLKELKDGNGNKIDNNINLTSIIKKSGDKLEKIVRDYLERLKDVREYED